MLSYRITNLFLHIYPLKLRLYGGTKICILFVVVVVTVIIIYYLLLFFTTLLLACMRDDDDDDDDNDDKCVCVSEEVGHVYFEIVTVHWQYVAIC